jgi:predicted DNA-binding mobile mystery protein A
MSKSSARVRQYFEARLERLRLVGGEPTPPHGWIRAIRNSLGMSGTELAARMGVGQSTVSGLERSEVQGTVRLDTLRRAAEALECDLVYYLSPRTTLAKAVRDQARRKALEELAGSGLTGNDDNPLEDHRALLERLTTAHMDRPGLWS